MGAPSAIGVVIVGRESAGGMGSTQSNRFSSGLLIIWVIRFGGQGVFVIVFVIEGAWDMGTCCIEG